MVCTVIQFTGEKYCKSADDTNSLFIKIKIIEENKSFSYWISFALFDSISLVEIYATNLLNNIGNLIGFGKHGSKGVGSMRDWAI